MTRQAHVFACLVHERPEVVADLVANLTFLEPSATILLYDGSAGGGLMDDRRVPRGASVVVHPRPRPMRWGRLHEFAIDSMEFALAELGMDALTIVDSDQLLLRPGYGAAIEAFVAGHPRVGLLGNAPQRQPASTRIAPARLVWREVGLWRPYLASLPGGADAFPHWTFWPSTVFTRAAAADLVERFRDRQLQALLRRTRIFATEEIVLPTLVAALGHEIAHNPASYEFVRYRVGYDLATAERALAVQDAFWMHPVPREIDHPLRAALRDWIGWAGSGHALSTRLDTRTRDARARRPASTGSDAPAPAIGAHLDPIGFADAALRAAAEPGSAGVVVASAASARRAETLATLRAVAAAGDTKLHQVGADLLLRGVSGGTQRSADGATIDVRRLVAASAGVEGWLEADEAAFLAVTARSALKAARSTDIVELGSFCGRGTVVLGGVAAATPGATVHAIDRFDGIVGEARRLYRCGPTLDRFRAAIAANGLEATVRTVVAPPAEAPWKRSIALLLVDGWHDHASVAADFRHYEPWLDPAALVAFHDYASYYPGVRRFVDELLASRRYIEVGRVRTMIVLAPSRLADRLAVAGAPRAVAPPRRAIDLVQLTTPSSVPSDPPLVSCIMPTFDRRAYVPDTIARFLAQDYPNRELIVIDDGTDQVADLMPADPRVRYLALPRRLTIGAKRNIGCEAARGSILANWDDDDWVATWRLRYEVEALLASGAEVVGLSTLLYHDPTTGAGWRYEYGTGGRPWVHDPTFCLRREVWAAERFPDANHGLDVRYLQGGRHKRIKVLADHRFYVGIIHPGNTSRKETRGSRWRRLSAGFIERTMAADGRDAAVPGPVPRPSAPVEAPAEAAVA